ncbi:Putative periplasmic protein [hydrothermal vent metagenome]|uniref:Putative periplasmic protein n=1 Tax=hydrothermal vent metagenome TaxID=652676 RepID=A0A1W1D4F2_9ZZZZ
MIYLQQYGLEIIIIFLAALVLYILYFVYTRDNYYNKDMKFLIKTIEEIQKEIFYLKKDLKEDKFTKQIKDNNRMSDEEIYQEIERNIYDMMQPYAIALEQIEANIDALKEQVDTRLTSMENGMKQFSIPSSIHAKNDSKVIALYQQGIDIDTIAKELHISNAEIEFILKLNKIK